MELESIIKIVLFSGLIGFAVFCASYALHVWRARNHAVKSAGGGRTLLRRWSTGLAMLGLVLLLATGILREATPREGILIGDDAFTVRADAELEAEFVIRTPSVKAGDVIARFRSPERKAELVELDLKRQILETQKQILEKQPLSPDPELVRLVQNLQNDRRLLQSSIRYLLPEEATVTRDKLRDRLDRVERLNALVTRARDTSGEIARVTAELAKANRYHQRALNLTTASAAAPLEVDDRTTEVVVYEAELTRLRELEANLGREMEHIRAGSPQFDACAGSQAATLTAELTGIRAEVAELDRSLEDAENSLREDFGRAEALRAGQLQQIELQIRQSQAKLESLQDVLVIRAPFDGVVAYSESAPQMAPPLAPVVVVAPAGGFRLCVRLPRGEHASLTHAGDVPLSLSDPVLYRRFPGRLLSWRDLPLESGHGIAELACMPPPETIRALASRDWSNHSTNQASEVWCRLMWRPPLYAVPLFWPAVVLLGVGMIGLALMPVMGNRQTRDLGSEAQAQPGAAQAMDRSLIAPLDRVSDPVQPNVPGAGSVEAGATGRSLSLLGQRLREGIRRQEMSASLLSALEWAIDRHHTRAIEHLSGSLDRDPELPAHIRALLSGLEAVVPANGARASRERFIRIMRAVAPELLHGPERSRDAVDSATEPIRLQMQKAPTAQEALPATGSCG